MQRELSYYQHGYSNQHCLKEEPRRIELSELNLDPFEDMFRRFQKSVQDTLWPNPLEKREPKHKETPPDRFIPQIN